MNNDNMMKKFHWMYNTIYGALHSIVNRDKLVAGVYNYLPKKVSIPYIRLRIVRIKNINMMSNFAMTGRLACDIYSYHTDEIFKIIIRMNIAFHNIMFLGIEFIVQDSWSFSQHNDILHAVLNFDVLVKGEYGGAV